MSFINEFMAMPLKPIPIEKLETPKHFRYMGELKHMLNRPENPYFKLTNDEVCKASENVVVKYNSGADGFRLYVWDGKRWVDFHPGPCTDYDGPRPEAKIHLTSSSVLNPNDQFHKMIREKTDELMEQMGFGYEYSTAAEIERHGNMVTLKYDLKYIGETDTNIRDNPLTWVIQIIHHTGTTIGRRTLPPEIGFVVTYKDVEYVYTGPDKGWVAINNYKKEETAMPVRYDQVKPNWLSIKQVIFNAPATIVLWNDGTKTVVKCENEEFDPEKGLAMAIAKKALGNQGNYYNQIRKWLPEKEDKPVYTESKEYIETVLVGIQELIVDMTFKGATKAELMRAIKHSKDLIDRAKGLDVDIYKSAETYGIVTLEEKYQPKSK